jgi:hypothetical protein
MTVEASMQQPVLRWPSCSIHTYRVSSSTDDVPSVPRHSTKEVCTVRRSGPLTGLTGRLSPRIVPGRSRDGVLYSKYMHRVPGLPQGTQV